MGKTLTKKIALARIREVHKASPGQRRIQYGGRDYWISEADVMSGRIADDDVTVYSWSSGAESEYNAREVRG